MTEPLIGRVVCPHRAGQCRCSKDDGHDLAGDPVHECHPDRCTGAWTGTWPTPDFQVVRFPWPVGPPEPWEFN